MENLYYLNHERFQKGDTKKALRFAMSLLKKDKYIDTITFLVYTAHQYAPFVQEELNIPLKACQNHVVTNDLGKKIQVHTVQTFQPGNLFAGHPDCEVLIAIGVPPKEQEKFIDCSRVKYWIIVPWLLDENIPLLNIFGATDIETGESLQPNYEVDERLKGAARWLLATSYPNEGYHHPFDEDRLKSMANAVAHYDVPFNYDAFIHYCIRHGFCFDAAKQTAENFYRARARKFPTNGDYKLNFLKQMMEETE